LVALRTALSCRWCKKATINNSTTELLHLTQEKNYLIIKKQTQ